MEDVTVYLVATLAHLVAHLRGDAPIMPFLPDPSLLDAAPDEAYPYDLVDVRGQEHQKMLPLHGHAQRLSIREHRWMTAGAARALGPRGLPGSPARFPEA
ncbi:MAG TPA: hypothetical protein VIC85_09415 [Ktedonobacterales bacterium]